MKASEPSSSASSSTLMENNPWCCHALPCSIDFQGMAPVHVFFHPKVSPPPNQNNRKSTDIPARWLITASDEQQYCGKVRFRGRQLLAVASPITVHGRVIQLVSTHENERTEGTHGLSSHSKSGGSSFSTLVFDSIQEWHHEDESMLDMMTGNSRVNTSMEWLRIARAVHDEI